MHQWRLLQVAAWYRGRKTTSSREITTSSLTETANTGVWSRRSTIPESFRPFRVKITHAWRHVTVRFGLERRPERIPTQYFRPLDTLWFTSVHWTVISHSKSFGLVRGLCVDGFGVKMRQRAKFGGDRSNRCWDTTTFWCFQDGGRHHLGFLKVPNLKGRKSQEGQNASSCRISRRSFKPLLRYGDFSIFTRWRVSAILDLWCARSDHPERAFRGLYRCAKFSWNQPNRCSDMITFRCFQDGGRRHIGFS